MRTNAGDGQRASQPLLEGRNWCTQAEEATALKKQAPGFMATGSAGVGRLSSSRSLLRAEAGQPTTPANRLQSTGQAIASAASVAAANTDPEDFAWDSFGASFVSIYEPRALRMEHATLPRTELHGRTLVAGVAAQETRKPPTWAFQDTRMSHMPGVAHLYPQEDATAVQGSHLGAEAEGDRFPVVRAASSPPLRSVHSPLRMSRSFINMRETTTFQREHGSLSPPHARQPALTTRGQGQMWQVPATVGAVGCNMEADLVAEQGVADAVPAGASASVCSPSPPRRAHPHGWARQSTAVRLMPANRLQSEWQSCPPVAAWCSLEGTPEALTREPCRSSLSSASSSRALTPNEPLTPVMDRVSPRGVVATEAAFCMISSPSAGRHHKDGELELNPKTSTTSPAKCLPQRGRSDGHLHAIDEDMVGQVVPSTLYPQLPPAWVFASTGLQQECQVAEHTQAQTEVGMLTQSDSDAKIARRLMRVTQAANTSPQRFVPLNPGDLPCKEIQEPSRSPTLCLSCSRSGPSAHDSHARRVTATASVAVDLQEKTAGGTWRTSWPASSAVPTYVTRVKEVSQLSGRAINTSQRLRQTSAASGLRRLDSWCGAPTPVDTGDPRGCRAAAPEATTGQQGGISSSGSSPRAAVALLRTGSAPPRQLRM